MSPYSVYFDTLPLHVAEQLTSQISSEPSLIRLIDDMYEQVGQAEQSLEPSNKWRKLDQISDADIQQIVDTAKKVRSLQKLGVIKCGLKETERALATHDQQKSIDRILFIIHDE